MSTVPATSGSILLEETRNGVRILQMNRPEVKNALSNDLTRALIRGLERASIRQRNPGGRTDGRCGRLLFGRGPQSQEARGSQT